MARLTDDEVQSALDGLPGWSREGDMIAKSYELPTFPAAIDFVVAVGERAEAANHHPDIDIRWRRVRLALTTHDEGGLSDKDVALATEIEGLAGSGLVISIIVALTVFAIVVATVVLFARDRGPEPDDIAIAYELAWDRLDFDALWSMSDEELRDGLDRHAYVAAKTRAYAGRSDLGHLIARVDLHTVDVGLAHAHVRTRVTLHTGETLYNDVMLQRRSSAWVVTGYSLAPAPVSDAYAGERPGGGHPADE